MALLSQAQCLGSHISLGRFASNWPFLWHAARIAPGPYRCWLASTGAIRQAKHKTFSEFWVQRHAGPALSPPGRNLGQPSPQGRLWL